MSLKLKKGSGDITIKIENNLFNKNKTSDKKLSSNLRPRQQRYMTQVKSPYEPEPDFLGEIRTALANRRLYEMRINPRPGVYNNFDEAHMRTNELNQATSRDDTPMYISDDSVSESDEFSDFDLHGNYNGTLSTPLRRQRIEAYDSRHVHS